MVKPDTIKAFAIADLIIANGLSLSVEIGVYRGRCLLPQAAVFTSLGSGRVIGIDPYSADEAQQHEVERSLPGVNAWVDEQDWQSIYEGVEERIDRFGMRTHCELLRTTSERACDHFDAG